MNSSLLETRDHGFEITNLSPLTSCCRHRPSRHYVSQGYSSLLDWNRFVGRLQQLRWCCRGQGVSEWVSAWRSADECIVNTYTDTQPCEKAHRQWAPCFHRDKNITKWRPMFSPVASPLWSTGARAPLTSNNFIFISLWTKYESQLSKYCVVCEISWCRCQQLTALSISHKTLSHRADAAPDPEVHRECHMT